MTSSTFRSTINFILSLLNLNFKSRTCKNKKFDEVIITLKDTRREKIPSNKTTALTESMNMNIWEVDSSIQLFIGGSYTETEI